MNYARWNIQVISTEEREVFKGLENFKNNVTVLLETKKKESGNETKGDYWHFYSRVSKDERARAVI